MSEQSRWMACAALAAVTLAIGMGCHERVVEDRPPRRERVVVVDPGPPPPPPVEVIPVSPGPEYVYVRPHYERFHDQWVLRHGYYDHRHY